MSHTAEYNRNYQRAIRADVLAAYGDGTCAQCGSTDDLQLDHVNGDGEEHRRAVCEWWGGSRRPQIAEFLYRLRKAGFPNDPPLQVLCKSCHTAKTKAEQRRTHCIHGHAYTPENTYLRSRILKDGSRSPGYFCRTCTLATQARKRNAKRKAASS